MEGLNGGSPEHGVQLGTKVKTTVLKPVGAQVVRLPSGETLVELELSPFEAVSLMLPEAGRQALVQALTGGIILGGDMPPGHNNG
jgi:hypothetical protein